MLSLCPAVHINAVLIRTALKFFCEGGMNMSLLVAVIGACAGLLLIYYVYILMKGDHQK